MFGSSEGHTNSSTDNESDRLFDGTFLGPEVGIVDVNLLGSNDETKIRLPLSISEGTEEGGGGTDGSLVESR